MKCRDSDLCCAGGQESTVVVAGEMQLNNVIFNSCTLIATPASKLTAINSTFKNCPLAVAASGEGTTVSFQGCTISDCQDGVVVTGGAAVAVTDKCTITCKENGSCISAHGVGSSATVFQSSLECTGDGPESLWRGCAAALRGGRVWLEGPDLNLIVPPTAAGSNVDGPPIRGWAGGVLSCGKGSVATVVGCDVSVSGYGVWAANGGAADVHKCKVTGSKRGLFVTDPTSHIKAAECAVAGCTGNCAVVRLGGHLSMANCSLCGSTTHCGVFLVGKGSRAVLKGCAIDSNTRSGVAVKSGAHVIATSCTAEKNGREGMKVWDGATAELSECKFMFSKGGGGLIVGGPKSHVKASWCKFSNNVSDGVSAIGGGVLHAVACQAFQNGTNRDYRGLSDLPFASRGYSAEVDLEALAASACGFRVSSADSKMLLENRCFATHNCAGGFVATHGACIEASDSLAGENGGPGAAVRCEASAVFVRCQFSGSYMASGVEAVGRGASAHLTECAATANGVSGMCVQDGASMVIGKCEATYNKSVGLYVDGDGSHVQGGFLSVVGNDSGMVVQQRAEVDLADCTLDHNIKKGLHVHSCGKATLRRCCARHTKHGGGVVVADGDSHVTLVACNVSENHGSGGLVRDGAKLEVCDSTPPSQNSIFSQNRMSNVRVETGGCARAQNCFLTGSVDSSGLCVDGEGSSATVANCTIAENADCGISVRNKATVHGDRVTIEANVSSGVQVQSGSQAELRAVTAMGCSQGSGLLVHGPGSTAAVAGCVASNNSASGMHAQEGGKVVAASSRTDGNGEAGVAVDGSSTVELCLCTSTDKKPYKAPKLKGCLVRKQCTPG